MAALREPDSTGKVRKVLTLGTPMLGSTKTLGLLEYKATCFAKEVPLKGCLVDPVTSQQIMKYMPGVYQLLPSREFDKAVGAPLTVKRGGNDDGEKPYDQWTAQVAKGKNVDPDLLRQAGEFHARYDTFELADPSVKVSRVVGTALSTPAQILEYNRCRFFFFSCKAGYKLKNSRFGGDGTVPTNSAAVAYPGASYDPYGKTETKYAPRIEHGKLAKDPDVLTYAVNYFRGTSSRAKPGRMGVLRVAGVPEGTKLVDAPQHFGGIELETVGPVSGYVSDIANNIMGHYPGAPRDAVVQNVPGGLYNSISDYQSFFLNNEGSYTGRLEVLSRDEVQLSVQTYSESQLDGKAIFRVNASKGARLQIDFANGRDLNSLRLLVDRDSDGDVDSEVAPESVVAGPDASDIDPPITTAAVNVDSKGDDDDKKKSKVTLTPQDKPGGSGVAATYYMVTSKERSHDDKDDDDEEKDGYRDNYNEHKSAAKPRLYTKPFTVPTGKTVRFLSVDRAGNTEMIREIVVDDVPNTRETAIPISTGKSLRRLIDPKGDEDWFRFEANGIASFRIQLLKVPADYDLELYDAKGNKLEAPHRRGKAVEEIKRELSKGTYYLRVVGYEGAWDGKHHYQLKVSTDKPRFKEED